MTSIRTDRRGQTAVVVGCFIVALFEGYDLQSMGVAAPSIGRAFGFTAGAIGIVLSASLVGLALGAGPCGRLADNFGRKPLILCSVLAFSVVSGLTAFAWDLPSFLVLRFLTGIGLGGAFPNIIALVADAVPVRYRGRGLSVMYCGLPAGGLIAAAVAGAVHQNWHAIFYFGSILPILILPLVHRLLPAGRRMLPAQAPRARSSLDVLFGRYAASTLLLWVSYFFTLFAVYLLLNWLPSLIISKGQTQGAALVASVALNIGGLFGSIVLGVCHDVWTRRRALFLTYLGMASGVLFLALAQGSALTSASFFAGFFVIGGQLLLYAAAPSVYPAADRGLGTGAAVAVGRLGAILGPVVAGGLLAAGLGASGVIGILLPGLLVAMIATLFIMPSA